MGVNIGSVGLVETQVFFFTPELSNFHSIKCNFAEVSVKYIVNEN